MVIGILYYVQKTNSLLEFKLDGVLINTILHFHQNAKIHMILNKIKYKLQNLQIIIIQYKNYIKYIHILYHIHQIILQEFYIMLIKIIILVQYGQICMLSHAKKAISFIGKQIYVMLLYKIVFLKVVINVPNVIKTILFMNKTLIKSVIKISVIVLHK